MHGGCRVTEPSRIKSADKKHDGRHVIALQLSKPFGEVLAVIGQKYGGIEDGNFKLHVLR
jgi:hypothetical protein